MFSQSTVPNGQCRFPNLTPLTPFSSNDTSRPSISSLQVRLSQDQTNALLSTLTSPNPSCPALLTSWAILLRCYTGQDILTFSIFNSGETEPTLASLALNDSTTVLETLGAKHLLQDGVQSGYSDTAVIFWDFWNGAKPSTQQHRLSLLVEYSSTNLAISLEWDTTLLGMTDAQGALVAGTLSKILSGVLSATPEARIKDIDFLSTQTLEHIRDINNKVRIDPVDRCIHDIIEDRAASHPDKDAVVAWDGTLTYEQLHVAATRLAGKLAKTGVVRSGEIVPLCFDKSQWNVVSMLAVLKAGCSFVPLDPTHPVERLRNLCSSVKARLILCGANHRQMLTEVVDTVLAVDEATVTETDDHERTPLPVVSSSDVAYIIFTSGSTGQPKGTIITHRAFSSSAGAHAAPLLIDSTVRTLQFAAHTFDASLVEILTPLMVGATVCIPSEHDRLNNIAGFINRTGVDHAVLTPSFVSFLTPAAVPGLRRLVLAGEAMAPSHVATWSHLQLCNGYGPAESAVCAATNSSVGPDTAPNDIGTPCGVRVWLVDPADHDRLVPVGCTGEMLLEGPSLATGYLSDPVKTSESFITDPAWALATGAEKTGTPRRFYKTGDLARYNSASGSLSYLGRKDTQIKLHGQRIELGEIEHHLSVDESVQHAVVMLPKSGPLAQRLIAVLSLRGHSSTAAGLHLINDPSVVEPILEGVRQRLGDRLPAYMVPATWLCVGALPMLASRKMDRKSVATWVESALTAEQCQKLITGTAGGSPASGAPESTGSETESKLRRIWSQVLNLPEEQISLHDHGFISLGGDSISAMACASHAKKAGLEVTVQDVLRAKSLHQLARKAKLMSNCADAADEDEEELLDTPFDLSPIQQLHFQSRGTAQGDEHFNQSFTLRLSRHMEPESVREALRVVIRRHGMLRARFHTGEDGKWQQVITDKVDASYRFRTHKVISAKELVTGIGSAQECLDIHHGPLFAAELFAVENGNQQILFMTAHHLVIDLVSWRVTLEEIEEILESPSAANAPVHQSLSFTKWLALQRDNSVSDTELSRTLQAAKNVSTVQFSYWGMQDNRPNLYGDVVCGSFDLDSATTATLTGECNVSLNTETVDILLASLAWSFKSTFTDRAPATIFNEGHGREALTGTKSIAADISRTIGWFTTLFPVALSSPSSFIDALSQIKDLRRRSTANGRAQFAAQFYTAEGRELQHKDMEISFNFLGRYQQLERQGALFQPAEGSLMAGEAHAGSPTADFGARAQRFALFEISAVIIQGSLKFGFAWNRGMLHQERIREWIANCRDVLTEAAASLPALQRRLTVGDLALIKDIVPVDLDVFEQTKLPTLSSNRGWDAIEDIYPATPIQQGLLLSRQKDEGTYAVRRSFQVKLNSNRDSSLKADSIITAWKGVVQHHALLRTVFVDAISQANAGSYDQVVLKEIEPVMLVQECANEQEMRHMLDNLPLMQYADETLQHRLAVFHSKSVPNTVYCALEMSHAIMDGASMDIILRDLSRSYDGSLEQVTRPLFSPFVASLQQRDAKVDLAFWKDHLKGAEPCHFPVLNDGKTAQRDLRTLRLQLLELEALRQFCDATGFTVPNALHAAWALTLGCYTGSADVCFGYLVTGRDAAVEGSEDGIGPYINMATQRVKLGDEEDASFTLLRVLEAVQKDQLDSIPFAQAPLAEVQHALDIPGGMAIFNTCVSYRRLLPTSNADQGPLSMEDLGPIHDPTEYPISLNIEVDEHGEAAVDLDYWTDMVASAQAENVAATFVQALSNISKHADKPVSQLDNVHPKTKEAIFGWNATISATTDDCLHRMVETQVALRPNQQAIRGWDADFTYAEMDSAANRLASHLSSLGVRPSVFVPVCFDKSAYTTIAMLAVLKAGGCVVPLNCNDPMSALEGKVRDTGTHIIVASESRAPSFQSVVSTVVSFGATLLSQLPPHPANFSSPITPSDPAFVMFTSGSTGKPKGVVLPHSALSSSTLAHGAALGLTPSTRFLQFAAHTFDNSIEEMFTTLIHGGCVCVPSEADRLGNLPGAIDVLDANFMDLTPTVAALITPSQVPKIKGLAVGGEALTREVLDLWGGAVPVHNQYGPTECSINATHKLYLDKEGDVANIGRSVGSVSWVVDPKDHNRLVPLGCVGELLIEGPILAQGYLNRPVETAKAFIENPEWAALDPRHGSVRRMYKTGDLVRYDSDGSLVYLGRKDTQVKLHGQRLEPAEIDHHVKACLPAGAQSSVELVTAGQSKALAVFICLSPSTDDARILPVDDDFTSLAQTIMGALTVSLASYMVPSLYFPVSSMPLTSSGKLDRRRLQGLVQSLPNVAAYRLGATATNGRKPETRMEKMLQSLWASVLNVPAGAIGADDSYFRHGGDSVMAMRLVAAARKAGVMLTVANIFQSPKLSDMASVATEFGRTDAIEVAPVVTPVEPFSLLKKTANMSLPELKEHIASICRIDPNSVEDIYPCTPLQSGLVAASQRQPGAYVAVSCYDLPTGTDIARFKQAWQETVASETILRTRILFVDGIGFLQVVVRTNLTWTTVPSIDRLSSTHRHLPPHDGGVLSSYAIVSENTSRPQFVWTAHHAVYDGWSLPTLLSRVEERYRQPGTAMVAAPQYSRFVEYLCGTDPAASDAFWAAKLSQSESAPQHFPQLPHPGYRVQATSHASRTIQFTKPKTAELTTTSFLRTAWALVLSTYASSDDVVFGEVLNGRDVTVSGIEDLVGPTLATVPRRIQINGSSTVRDVLSDVQAQLNDVIPHQFAGLQRIKSLNSATAAACDFQNLLVIDLADEVAEDSLFSKMISTTQGADFFSYPVNVTCAVGGSAGNGDVQVELRATFDDNVVPSWQMARMLAQFETILSQLTAPALQHQRLAEVDLLNADDKAVIREWNRVPGPVVEKRIHDLVSERMSSHPEGTAVVGWDATLTNAQLETLSTALAQKIRAELRARGKCAASKFVPFCFEKSAFAVVAMLAVLKAGGAFVPLDPSHPVARLREILGDCSANVILCSPKYERLCAEVANPAGGCGISVIPVTMPLLNQWSLKLYSALDDVKVQPSDPAYLIFTSGSTGRPKGVQVSHTAFCSGAAAHGPAMHMEAPFRFLQFGSYTFDSSLVEILTTLMLGGTVCVPSDEDRTNGNLAAVMEQMEVTMTLLTPSFAKTLQPADVPHLKTLILGGEAMSQSHIATWADSVTLVNAYGPSECAVVATVNPRLTLRSSPANLGRGIGRVWIVDPRNHDRLAPLGSVGELVVEGPTLSTGYRNNEAKTREVFIEDPAWTRDSTFVLADTPTGTSRRMYKTGDLVRAVDDVSGEMLYIGRKDSSQAKLNGQRLELDEIIHHLSGDSDVRHAVVLLPKTGPCAKRLVAVVSVLETGVQENTIDIDGFQLVTAKSAAIKVEQMQERLRAKLPPYMVPSTWLVLASIPLLPSGKLDRRSVAAFVESMSDATLDAVTAAQSLGQLDDSTTDVSSDLITDRSVSPSSSVSSSPPNVVDTLRAIWSQVLNISPQKITKTISFLHLGGDSISAIQVMARCRAEGISVTVPDIIGSKSIHDLALKVRGSQQQQISAPNEDHHEFDLSPIQQLYFEQMAGETPDNQFNQSVLLRLAKPVTSQQLNDGLHALVKTHSMLRARFRRDRKGNWRQRLTQDVNSSYRFKTHSISTRDRMKKRIEATQKAFNIQDGPLMAADWFAIGGKDSNEVCILITIHHLVVDVVSWGILLQDLEDFLATGRISPPTSLPFQAWTRKQSEQAQSQKHGVSLIPHHETADADLDYWGMADVPNFHGDVAVVEDIELDADATKLLLGAECNTSLQTEPLDILLAALLLSYRNATVGRQGVPTIYNEGHGREVWEDGMDLSRTVGWFTALYPVHLPDESSSDYDIVNAIRWVKDYRARLAGKGRPYFAYRLLTSQGQEEYSQRWPVEVAFNYLGKMQQLSRTDTFLRSDDEVGSSINSESDVGKAVSRLALVEVSAVVAGGQMKLSFAYNKHMKHQDSLIRWAKECRSLLQEAAGRLSQHTVEKTLSEFPLLPLAYYGMENLNQRLRDVNIDMQDVEDVYPCTPMQRGLLLSWMRDPEKYAYKALFQVESSRKGQIDVDQLLSAWQTVVQRHATLRTVFVDTVGDEGLMDQVVLRSEPGRTQVFHCDGDREEALDALNQVPAIDYNEKKPPHRLVLCTTASGDVFCRLEISHAIADGSSLPILLDDLADAFAASSTGTTSINKPVPLYRDYMSYIQSQSRGDSLSYWSDYLSGAEPCLFPSLTDGLSSPADSLGAHMIAIDDLRDVQSYCADAGITLSTLLQLVWALVVRSYTGSDDVVFGYLSSGRDVPVDNVHNAVGAFINMLVCRMRISDDAEVGEVLETMRADVAGAMAHQGCSLAEIQHELKLDGAALFNTAFTYQKRRELAHDHASSSKSALQYTFVSAEDPSEYAVAVNVEATDRTVEVHFSYWRQTVSDAQMANVAATFRQTLNDLVQGGSDDRAVGEIDLVGANGIDQLCKWNDFELPRTEACVHDIVAAHAAQRPDAPAVCGWDASFTYRELDDAAATLARYLTAEGGVGPDVFVPLCFEKSAWTVVAQLAVLKAGGAFVNLDPAFPRTRLEQAIQDVDAKIVLCSPLHKEKMDSIIDKVFVVDAQSVANLTLTDDHDTSVVSKVGSWLGLGSSSPATPSNAAYIIFTSGTTGKPKGTVIEHGAFCTGAAAHAKAMFMRPDSRVLQFASYTFDASIMETLSCLLVGGCVCVPSDAERMNDIAAVIRDMGVTWTLLTPSVAATLKPESVACLKTLVTGGEAMAPGHIERWGTQCALVNAWGPTECSVVGSTSTKVDEEHRVCNADSSNIGTAVGGRLWIVDTRSPHRLVPVGAVGELIVEGRLVARGYLNEPEKTAKAFISAPVWTKHEGFPATMFVNNDRMYRTGDLCRYNSDGTVSYVSRIDTQVKLNGRRIELGEIEFHCQAALPEGSRAAVEVVVPGKAKTLAVFYSLPASSTISDGSEPTSFTLLRMTDSLRDHAHSIETGASASLPSYMVPVLFVPVSTMPWTTAGKLDRRRLRQALEEASPEDLSSYRLSIAVSAAAKRRPASEMEKTLQSLWEATLGLAPGSVGVTDSFFNLGGDSLTAIRLVGAARARKLRLSVLDIFEKPVLADMALACGGLEAQVPAADLKPVELVTSSASDLEDLKKQVSAQCQLPTEQIQNMYPCSPLQEGLVALANKQEGAYVAVNTLKIPAHIDLDIFKAAWQEVIDTTDTLRTRIVHTTNSGFLQVVASPEPIEWYDEASVEEAIAKGRAIGSQNGGMLSRYTIVQGEQESDRSFIWAIHHALYDGWSLPMVARRVQDVYNQKTTAPSLSSTLAPSAPYVKFIEYLARRDMVASENYWKDYLSGAASITHFPQLPPSNREKPLFRAETIAVKLNRKDIQVDITVPTLIRAAWAVCLAAYNGTEDVAFGETLSGRNIDVEGIMDMAGPTFTTVPVRVQLARDLRVVDFLQRMHATASSVVAHQHFGLQRIMKLDADCAGACDFKNLLTIRAATGSRQEEQLRQEQDADWDFEGGSPGEGFFTHPLVLECNVTDAEVAATFHYDENVLSSWHTKRLSHQLEAVLKRLAGMSGRKDAVMADVDVISPEDVALLNKWNRPETSADVVDSCIHTSFLEQAAATPDAVGISGWDAELTYAEIKEYAVRLATQLKELGVKEGTLVPVCLERSAWSIVILMGVLMAGGAFVPFDPAHPLVRQKEMLEDLKPLLIICSPEHESRFAGIVELRLSVDGDMLKALPPAAADFTPSGSPTSTAYVLFTSGSTGKPKGVVVAHRDFTSSSRGFARATHMTKSSRSLHFASLSFDVALMEILTPLTLGATVCVPTGEERLTNLGAAIARLGATWAFLTPSVANLLDPDVVCPVLKTLVCGGEAMVSQTIARFAERVELINGYGPTEASVLCIVNPSVSTERDPSIIGRGTLPCRTWILQPGDGRETQLAPVGAVGELAVSGPLLARGYMADAAKTAAVFIDNPRWAKSVPSLSGPSRIYRTGDLVRYRQDGALEFLGRKDGQVKVNGQRVELGEIDSALSAHRHVNHGLVVQPKTGPCRKQLVGIVTLRSSGSAVAEESVCRPLDGSAEQLAKAKTEIAEIRSHLSDVLPTYMVPAAWIVLTSMPVVVSGKLDRKRVATWVESLDSDAYEQIAKDLGLVEEEEEDVAVTGTAGTMRDIWAKELQVPVEKIRSNKPFLSLGGDSIRAMGVVSRARTAGLGVSIQDVLRSKSVIHLAQLARSLAAAPTTESAGAEESDEPFALSPVQAMYMQMAEQHSGDARFNQSNLLSLAGRVSVPTIKRAMEAIVKRHSMLRARFVRKADGGWEQKVAKMGPSAFRCIEHHLSSQHEMTPLMAATQSGLSIEDGPVFAVDLLKVAGSDNTIVYMVAHHLVVDIVSWRVVLRDLTQILETNTPPTDTPLSFRSWLDLQASHDKTVDPKTLLPFEETPPNMAYWGVTDPLTYGRTVTDSFEMSENITKKALVDCHKAFKSEPTDLFLGGIASSFARTFTDRDVPSLHTESHGREVPGDSNVDLSGTVGWFTTISPLVVPVRADDLLDAVRRVKDIRRAIPANGRPYFAHKYLSGTATASPMEVLFNYHGGAIGGGDSKDEETDPLIAPFEHDDSHSGSDSMATADVGPQTKRLALFEISAAVVNNRLQFSFIYDSSLSQAGNVRRWIAACKATLETMVQGLMQRPAEPTLSDYPLLPLTYDDLAALVKSTLPRVGISQPSTSVEDIYPCTPVQEGMLISQLRNPSAYIFHAIYNVGHTKPGVALSAKKIRQAWQKVVDRHASLRTVFIESAHSASVFDQVVLKNVDSGAILLEGVAADDVDAERRLGEITMANRTGQPLLPHQVAICTTTSGNVLMKLEVNHVAVDGGSLSLVIGDLIGAYNGTLDPGPGPLFSNYIKFIQSQPAQADTRYWMRYLKGLEPCHFPQLATASETEVRALHSTKLQFSRFPELRKLSEQTQVTLANIMHAAWAFVLRRYTGSDDVCFGYLTMDRDAPVEDIRTTVGTLINMLCCRVRISRSQTLEDVFRTTQEQHLESTQYQRCSLANVQHALGMGGRALYNTSISTQNHSKSEEEGVEENTVTFEMQAGHDPSEYAVTVNIETSKNEEGAVFRYWDDHISDEQANEMAGLMAKVLNRFLDSPAQSVGEYDEEHGRKPVLKLTTTITDHEAMESDSTASTPTCEGSPCRIWGKSFAAEDIYEATLLSLWSSALHIPEDSIGADDSYFAVGGDSITAMKLVSEARDRGLALTVADVFQHPIFADMAACVRASEKMDGSIDHLLKVDAAEYDHYERFSLLAANNVDAFLQTSIVPQVCVFRGGLADVLPATDFQSLAVSGALLESQFMLNYFFLDGEGPLDLARLRRACMQLVQDLDILRTVFVPSGGRFLQVVLRTLRPAFDTVDLVDSSIEDYTSTVQQHGRATLRLGDPFVAFTVIRHRPSNRHRLLLRLSHAQYDGVCLPKILEALQAAYNNTPTLPPPSFANYLRASAGELSSAHYAHWTSLLSGSRMTQLVSRSGPNYSASRGKTVHLQRTIPIPPVEAGHITTATVIKAAWAYVLSSLTNTRDVVFGHTISGRNAAVSGVANMVGPCVNLLPVRVSFPPSSTQPVTAKDLFAQIQTQQLTNMPHEILGFRDIVRHCTSWPAHTYFTTAVQHQNLDPQEEVRIGSTSYKVGCASATDQGDWSDINVVSQPLDGSAEDEGMVEVTLSYNADGPIPASFAERALDMLCEAAVQFSSNPEGVVSLDDNALEAEFTVPFPDVTPTTSPDTSILTSLSPTQRDELLSSISSAWREVLLLPPQTPINPSTSFFDLGGDIVHLAQLVWLLTQDQNASTPPVKLDDLISSPTLGGHMALISGRIGSVMGGSGEGGVGEEIGSGRVGSGVDSDEAVPEQRLKRVDSPLRKAVRMAMRLGMKRKGDKRGVQREVGVAAAA